MKTKTIKQTAEFKVSPLQVYEALMDPKKHAKFTGESAKINQKEGGSFSVYSGYASGKNIKLVPGKLIVQSWTTTDWPKGHYSEVIFEFQKSDHGTKMTFTQKDVPEANCASIKDGWKDFYWKRMEEYFSSLLPKETKKIKPINKKQK